MTKLGVTPQLANKYYSLNVAEAAMTKINVDFAKDFGEALKVQVDALLDKVLKAGYHVEYDDFHEYCFNFLEPVFIEDFELEDAVNKMKEKINVAHYYHEMAKGVYGDDSEEAAVMLLQVEMMIINNEYFNELLGMLEDIAYYKLQIAYAGALLSENVEAMKLNADYIRENIIEDIKSLFSL